MEARKGWAGDGVPAVPRLAWPGMQHDDVLLKGHVLGANAAAGRREMGRLSRVGVRRCVKRIEKCGTRIYLLVWIADLATFYWSATMSDYRYFHVEDQDEQIVIRMTEPQLYGDIVGEVLRLELTELIKTKKPRCLLIDFERVTTISSSIIAALLAVKRRLDREGGELKLCDVPPAVRQVFRTLHLEGNLFEIV